MTTMATPPATVRRRSPGFEGANIRTWIGFKHFMYLVEDAVLAWIADQGAGPRVLFHEHGLGVEIVDCSIQLPSVLELGDEVTARTAPGTGDRLAVTLTVQRDDVEVVVARAKVVVALVRERTADRHVPAPGPLAGLEVGDVAERCALPAPAPITLGPGDDAASVLRGGLLWTWRAPYFYCHYSDRVQHSGFVRTLEEVVDRYLAERGISVGRLLTERSWIPVVSRARISLLGATHMEEEVHTVFTVGDVLRGTMFDARMDCWVRRGDVLVPVATASILHGYAIAAGPGAGGMAVLDDAIVEDLRGVAR